MSLEVRSEVIILRGISGAGKSTFAKKFREQETRICSADDFFMRDGNYVFDWRLLKDAHKACLKKFISLCFEKFDGRIILDNVNAEYEHIQPYVLIAETFNRPVRIITIEVRPEVAEKRNVHGVPARTIIKQLALLRESEKRFPKEWRHSTVKE